MEADKEKTEKLLESHKEQHRLIKKTADTKEKEWNEMKNELKIA